MGHATALRPRRQRFYYLFAAGYFIFQIILLVILRSLNEEPHTSAFNVMETHKELAGKLDKNTELDDTGLYKIIQISQQRSDSSLDITVVTQCSSNHLNSVENLFRAWEGPISVSVYTEVKDIGRTLWDISLFIHCNNWREFGMNLVIPLQDTYVRDYQFPYTLLPEADEFVSCVSNYVSEWDHRNYNGTTPYPVNLLRNIAKMSASTDYILVIDIDMIPSTSLRRDFLNFIKLRPSDPEKFIYVVPTFEAADDFPMPLDKTALIKALKSKLARQFYVVPCESCQKLTGYDQWLRSEPANGTRVLYEIEWQHPWEPFFIARRHIPNYDERFKQYGMNRVSHVCELYVAGYKFFVLDNLFLVHKGYKKQNDFHATKSKEMEANRRLYKRFKTEVWYKYPDSEKRC